MTDAFAALTGLDILGLAGVAVYLFAYAALQLGFVRGQSYVYPGLNLVAASLVLAGLVQDFNLPAALIQVSFITISLVGMARFYLIQRRARFSEAERELLEAIGLDVPAPLARRFLDLGTWIEADAGTVLTAEGELVGELAILTEGQAVVSIESHLTAVCRPICLIGEISCLDAVPATASVVLTRPSRLYCIGAEGLRKLARREPELANALRASFNQHISTKLQTQNAVSRRLMSELRALADAGEEAARGTSPH